MALAEANAKHIADKLNEYVGKSAACKKIGGMYANLITSAEYLVEDEGGPLRKKANSCQAALDLLSKRREEAFASIRDVCGAKGALGAHPPKRQALLPIWLTGARLSGPALP